MRAAFWMGLLLAGLLPLRLSAQIAVVASPPSGASGVGTSQPVSFVFDTPMDPDQTSVLFIELPSTFLSVNVQWTFGYTVLTCTPSPAWPAGNMIAWNLDGVDFLGESSVSDFGYFTTSGSSGGGGHGTNAITSYTIQAVHFYNQTGTTAPTLDPDLGYAFFAGVSLASNRTATAITVDLPTGSYLDLAPNPIYPEDYTAWQSTNYLEGFNQEHPAGTYTFSVYGAPDQTVTLELSAPTQQPSTPHLTNYTAVQAVNPTQPFTLGWDAFSGGLATDYIAVEIGTAYASPEPGKPGALTGLDRTVVIPAGTLQPSTSYDCYVTFFRSVAATNTGYSTASVRATQTAFTLLTGTGTAPSTPPVLTNTVVMVDGTFQCEVRASPGQQVNVLASTTLQPGSWNLLLTTNSLSGVFEFRDSPVNAPQRRFYRAESAD